MEAHKFLLLTISMILPMTSLAVELHDDSQNQLSEHHMPIQHTRFQRSSSRVCYGSHGCFSWTGDFYDILKRPIMYNPYFNTSHIKYALYTRKSAQYPHYLKRNNDDSLNMTSFDPKKQTKFVVHGWSRYSQSLSSLKSGSNWMMDLKDALLERDDLNVILVNWKVGSDYHYMKAAPNARLAGADIALMVKYLKQKTGAKPEDFHVIGNSLGAQVAGYAGTRLHQMGYTLGRITGLDPAEQYFQGMPESVRLDPSDAKFVDIIHTNGGYSPLGFYSGLGVVEPSGHVDFYVNGGKDQPGCYRNDRCSHCRAQELFISSVKRRCSYQATLCYDGIEQFSYPCDIKYVNMGYDADKTHLKQGKHLRLYVKTEGSKPYCQIPDTVPKLLELLHHLLNTKEIIPE